MIAKSSAYPLSSATELAELVERLIASVKAGTIVDEAALLADHPDHAEELRHLLPAVHLMADLSRSGPENLGPSGEMAHGTLGDYRIVREVGRGGMGVVYEAEQISLNRRVALKVLPFAATMDPRHLQRFRNEAQAAACLHHANIVPVHGVGCERGVHYYAMQLIEGQTLAQAIAEIRTEKEGFHHRGTENTEKREKTVPLSSLCSLCLCGKKLPFFRRIAELVAHAADALEYAHSMGVVHRDIKPANLMLDDGGNLWVTDFGLAKLNSADGMTMTGDIIGTLRYMSPEQALAKHGLVDHRTDVYSLGATLYELLTLRPAVQGADKQEILKRIAFEEPVSLRRIDKLIPAELETITLKSLAKEPGERYTTARELSDDLRRWLGDQAIKTKPPNLLQRSAGRMRRHPKAAAAAFAAAMLAAVGAIVSTVLIDRQKQRAEERFQIARAAVDDMYTRVADDWLNDAPYLTELQKEFLEKALQFYARFGDEYGSDPAIRYEVAQAWHRIARIQNKLGNRVEAEAACRQAIARSDALVTDYADEPRYRAGQGQAYQLLSTIPLGPMRSAEHENAALRAIEIQKRLVAESPALAGYWPDLAKSYRSLSNESHTSGRHAEGLALLKQALEIQERLAAAFPQSATYLSELGAVLGSMPDNNPPTAEEQRDLLRAIKLQEAALKIDPRRVGPRYYLAVHWQQRAFQMGRLGRYPEAEGAYGAALEYNQRLLSDFPAVPEYRNALVHNFRNMSAMFILSKRYAKAADAARTARDHARTLVRQHPDRAAYQRVLTTALQNLHFASRQAADQNGSDRMDWLREARSAMQERAQVLEHLISWVPPDPGLSHELSGTWTEIARTMVDLGEDRTAACELLRRAIDLERKALADRPQQEDYQNRLTAIYVHLARIAKTDADELFRTGRIAEAEKIFVGIQQQYAALVAEFPGQTEAVRRLGDSYIALGNFYAKTKHPAEELAAWEGAVKYWPDYHEPGKFLGNALIRAGRTDEGVEALRRAVQLKPDYFDALRDLGYNLWRLGRPQEALEPFSSANKLKPDDPIVLHNLGTVLKEMNRFGEAEKHLRRAAELNPAQSRYAAACVAVLAADADRSDGKVGDDERRRLWRQAFDWLSVDLAVETKRAEKATERASVLEIIHAWQTNADLAGVRDAAGLQKLPEAERTAWQKFWADVAALMKRCEETPPNP